MKILSAFTITPGVSFLGISKSKAHCFTLAKKYYPEFIKTYNLGDQRKYAEIVLIIRDQEYRARIRWINQDQSKIRDSTKNRNWKPMIRIQFDWKIYPDTKSAIGDLCSKSIDELTSGKTRIEQRVKFEHLGENKFYISV